VTAIAAPSRYRVSVRGRQDHAGGTPMADRRDAVAAAAELVLLVERLSKDAGRGMVGTVGVIEARPSMINIVAGEADLLVDFRGIDAEAIGETLARFEAGAAEIGTRRGVAVEWASLMRESPLSVGPEMVAAIGSAGRCDPSAASRICAARRAGPMSWSGCAGRGPARPSRTGTPWRPASSSARTGRSA
jgi:beta-ureidopropionase / N-carbamoyl-L-amino-acid hydrolase